MLSSDDRKQIAAKGVSEEIVIEQLSRFKKGFAPLKISSSAKVGSGILRLSREQTQRSIDIYENASVEVAKFVPASGAASRMFKLLYTLLEDFDGTPETIASIDQDENLSRFFEELDQFAFYEELKTSYKKHNNDSIENGISEKKYDKVVDSLLNSVGLDYGNLPKGLLSFHRYPSSVRTAAEEQIDEGVKYACKEDQVNLHFTVSPNHMHRFQNHVANAISRMNPDVDIQVTYSVQKEKTDTIASTLDFMPFKSIDGQLLFRPAGHGALLENLNDLTADLVFIKNIDNVVPDRLKEITIKYKKVLAGVLLDYQQKSFNLLRREEEGEPVYEDAMDLLNEMGIKGEVSKEEARKLLDRPIRVCGMVKNEGEPGGGPFWVENETYSSLQIVESAQINGEDKKQQEIFESGTHFNPVDLVCGLRNYRGEKFDLLKQRDEEAGFISEKSFNGEKLFAMELPGLWNGSMAHWNTIFVEVPLETFNPVKTVLDLLKPNHR